MELHRYSTVAEFLSRAEVFLVEHEAEHNLILGLCSGMLHGEWNRASPYLAAVEEDAQVVLAAVRTPPYGLVLSRCDRPDAVELVLRDVLMASDWCPSVNGPPVVSGAFAECWRAATAGTYSVEMEQRIYQLDRVAPSERATGELRAATPADREMAIDWRVGFYRDALAPIDRGAAAEAVDRALDADPATRGLYFWQVDGRPVSMVGYAGMTQHGVRIGAVYTPEPLRRRGYASAAVAALSQRLLDAGRRFCFLYTDLANPTSNHIYQAIGYRPVADSRMIRFVREGSEAPQADRT